MESLSQIFKSRSLITKLVSLQVRRNIFWKTVQKKEYDVVTPWARNSGLFVTNNIVKPSYSESGIPFKAPLLPEKLSSIQIEALRRSCILAAEILRSLKNFIQVGVTTEKIDYEVHKLCLENNAYPSPLNYQHFPKSCCTSVNNVACHGIPDSRPLANGDIVNVDVTVFREGVHGDCSTMFLVGDVDDKGKKLCAVTREALDVGVSVCKPGVPIYHIGAAIEDYVRKHRMTVIPCFTGHGIGTYFHGPPEINHIKCEENTNNIMEEGVCFTIEPVVGDGSPEILILEDNWTAVTVDDSRSAQYEYTVLITKDGAEILTPIP